MLVHYENCASSDADLSDFFSSLNQTNPQTPFFKVLHKKNHSKFIASLQPIAAKIKSNFKTVILIGMGGAINNPLSILPLQKNKNISIITLCTTDFSYIEQTLEGLDLKTTFCISISNTGNTLETTTLTSYMIERLKSANLAPSAHMLAITSDTESELRTIATKETFSILAHEQNIGGRFSFFGTQVYLIALICDIDINAIINGANEVLEDLWEKQGASEAARAALAIFYSKNPITVSMSYAQNLANLLDLYTQLISESLGKANAGFTPLKAIGPIDQHSTLQLFLEGPADKFYTIITVKSNASNDLEKIHSAMAYGTTRSLIAKHLPVRTITLDSLNEVEFGKLLMLFYAETIILAHLMKIDAFNQPGVEQIKILAKQYLLS